MSIDPDLEPLLPLDEVQGNILGGFNKDHQALLALGMPDSMPMPRAKQWLASLAAEITPLRAVHEFRRMRKRALRTEGIERLDMGSTWKAIAFSHSAIGRLTPDADQFTSTSFRAGLAGSAQMLGDPTTDRVLGSPSTWIVGADRNAADVFCIIASDNPDLVTQELQRLTDSARVAGFDLIYSEIGHDLSFYDGNDLRKGHEHFGFKDGISQPGVRGRVDESTFFTDRLIEAPQDPSEPSYASLGQALVAVGTFVLGYATQNATFGSLPGLPDPLAPAPNAVAPSWARNGSFLVFRRLNQDVPAFNRFVTEQAAALALPAVPANRLAALFVGRWKSGAPLARTAAADDPKLGRCTSANNAFLYALGLITHDGFPDSQPDFNGNQCPIVAHVRKVNPRDLPTDVGGGANETLPHRILRRGIPFGPPLPDGALEDEEHRPRGLLFLSYQRSIEDGFEFLSNRWMNSSRNPQSLVGIGEGFDMLVGANSQDPTRQRSCIMPATGQGMRLPTRGLQSSDWVYPSGGGYFFAPSLSALRDVLAR
jgi:Dyp-type peroxidase family